MSTPTPPTATRDAAREAAQAELGGKLTCTEVMAADAAAARAWADGIAAGAAGDVEKAAVAVVTSCLSSDADDRYKHTLVDPEAMEILHDLLIARGHFGEDGHPIAPTPDAPKGGTDG